MRQPRIMVEVPPARKTLCPYSVSLLPLTMMSVWSSKKETIFSEAGTFSPLKTRLSVWSMTLPRMRTARSACGRVHGL